MSQDPASLNVSVTFTGLSNDEATIAVSNLPAGSTSTIAVAKFALGGKRFELAASELSVYGAKNLVTAVFLHLKRVADGDDPEVAPSTSERP